MDSNNEPPDSLADLPLEFIINHVFLPPKLPQSNDTTSEVEAALVNLFHESLNTFINHLPEDEQDAWIKLPPMLDIIKQAGDLESQVNKLDEKMTEMVEGDAIALHLAQQNAGLILRKHRDTYSVETFELSASYTATTSTIGRLVRRFPGPVIAISDEQVKDDNFRQHFTTCLASLDSQTLDEALRKGTGSFRDSVHPQFATEWLPGLLRGIGSPLDVTRIYKRTRDDVIWGEGSLEPWRRSSRWLLLRVAVQTSIASSDAGHTRYKIFMIYFMARVLELAVDYQNAVKLGTAKKRASSKKRKLAKKPRPAKQRGNAEDNGFDAEDGISSDILYIMLAKLHRRIQKLGVVIKNEPWAEHAEEVIIATMENARTCIAKRWKSVQKSLNSAGKFHLSELKNLKPESNTSLRLSKLRPYLESIHTIRFDQRADVIFDGKCTARIDYTESSLPDLNHLMLLMEKSPLEIQLTLMDLELWVSNCLDSWLLKHTKSPNDMDSLSRLTNGYMSKAMSQYVHSPEGFSIMILTLMLLWKALDKSAVSQYPLLSKFNPGFPSALFDPLLLPKRHQMAQLRDVERYILKRKENSLAANPSMFGDITSPTSFGAQYFDLSKSHQVLKTRIEREARVEENEKKRELKDSKAEFARLMALSNQLKCTYFMKSSGQGRRETQKMTHDARLCNRCIHAKDARALKIACFEWPLPLGSIAKCVVFELDIPSLIRSWRSTTYRMLADVLSTVPPPHAKSKNTTLTEYVGLTSYLRANADRLQLASSTKPQAQTSRGWQLVPEATADSVCLPNNLSFVMHDAKSNHPALEHLKNYNIQDRCTLKLPQRSGYNMLQYALNGTNHTPNQVMSARATCPGLNEHEVHAFTALRSGHRLQWLNIARELASWTLNFGSEEVYLLLLQASCQVGPAALQQVARESHVELEEEDFGRDLLSSLETGMSAIEGNWQGLTAALVFTLLASRLLSVSLHDTIRARSLRFLEHARAVISGWLRDVLKLLHDAANESEVAYLSYKALDLALICHTTFDLDPRQLSSLLSSTDCVAILIETATVVHDRLPLPEVPLTTLTRELLRRFHRTSQVLESTLKEKIIASSNALNKAVKRIWPGYASGAPWIVVDAPNNRWLTTRSLDSDNAGTVTCHYNILTGEFLINGRPLSRLSPEYETHPTYQRLFGNKVLGVVPSSKGLAFETRNSVHGFQIHFALHDKQLIVRAIKDLEMYDIVPLSALEDDFPRTFLEEYVHWVHRGTLEVEWRPLESKWTPSPDNWRISEPEDVSKSFLELNNKRVVDPGSTTAKAIHRWLKPLESSTNINIFHNADTDETDIRLPRLNLDFILRKNGLESKMFRGMIVDTNQYIGTLHGLLHKLVLRGIHGKSQAVIVPHGNVTFRREEHHVQVSISTGSSDKASYHKFDVDKVLGSLKDNGSLKSRLFKLYLHALTSHCLPDSLTGRTGSEEALHGLTLASTRSYFSVNAEHVEQLKLFARLTPAREFHPKGSKFMHTVSWEDLSPLSHHERFVGEANLILSQAKYLRTFLPEEEVKYKTEQRGASELHVRASIRYSFFRVDTFGAEKFTASYDKHYGAARDSISNSSVEIEACYVATMVNNWSCRLDPLPDLFAEIKTWGLAISGPLPDLKFEFDNRWLDYPGRFMPQYWCSMQLYLSSSNPAKDKCGIAFFLANLAKSNWGNIPLVHTLIALATAPALRNLQPPPHDSYDLSKGFEPNKASILHILDCCKIPYEQSQEISLPRESNEQDVALYQRRMGAYNGATKLTISKCLHVFVRQWPTKAITCPQTADIQTYLPGLKDRMEEIRALFEHWYKNFEFRNYIEDIQIVLDSLSRPSQMPEHYAIPPQEDKYFRLRAYFKISDLLNNPAPQLPIPQNTLGHIFAMTSENNVHGGEDGSSKLKSLLGKLSRSATGNYQKDYVSDLRKSYTTLLTNSPVRHKFTAAFSYETLKNHLKQATENLEAVYKIVCSKFVISGSAVYESASKASLLPRMSPGVLLKLLARFNGVVLSAEWKTALVHYALAVAEMQRAERLVACGERDSEILLELTNGGHTNWDPEEYPEWLLLELENNILIRPEQAQIAGEMIEPHSGANSIMQLNMGLGKSSVIVPIVAATLADKYKLVRVIVLKSLSDQMFQLLVDTLGGLIGRRIYRLPISRALKPTLKTANLIQSILKQCMTCGGVLLVQPESILSFELLGIDHVLARELGTPLNEAGTAPGSNLHDDLQMSYKIGKVMVETQQWLYKNARDILDESDEILSVKYELIYPLGVQMNLQFGPDRWVIIERVLAVLGETAHEMVGEFPDGLEIIEGVNGGFPRIRILKERVGTILMEKVAKSICRSGMSSLPTWTFSEDERVVVLEFLTIFKITKARAAILDLKVFKTEFIKMSLLLLRGLFAAGVLEFVFSKKRWRVNYGLDLSRSMLSVPYHAKDNPSPRSEFSHPDTAIALTCLSYYYGGLTDQQIFDSFEELLLSDQSQEEYMRWIQNTEEFPQNFKRLAGVNLRDKRQCCQDLFPWLRFSKNLIDYYLEHLVFPKEMMEFSNKLSSSGWEIAREKRHPTTGFSGTNDSKYMLPTSIKQVELLEQLSTNADVLACLLRAENSYDTMHTPKVETLDASALLDIAVQMVPPVRVILDVGAQLLEDNRKIATQWLAKVPHEDAQAVVFFCENDLCVLDREGMMEPLLISPFARQLDRTIIYLDEAHTRGTDLKMPVDYRAIVTLGPDLTKDRLAQACKRLRKLGHGQSVVFCAPPEVRLKLLECSGKKDPTRLGVEDVLFWTIRNSWEFTRKGMPLWATQGIRYYRRHALCDYSGEIPQIPKSILEPEALSLEQRYGLDKQSADEKIVRGDRGQADPDLSRAELSSLRSKCREFGLKCFGDSDLHEEQERELHPENEREQQIEAQIPVMAHKHTLHPNIRQLVRTGVLTTDEGYTNAFSVFSLTRARSKLRVDDWPKNLLVTHDFCTTVQISQAFDGEGNKDSYLRPVNWVLSFKDENGEPMYLIMSPYEVQELLPHMRCHNRVRLHVYTPRLSLSNRSLEDLSFCAVPPLGSGWTRPAISTALNLFAGQLYLSSEAEYHRLCRYLGVRFEYTFRGVQIGTDGFISPETRAQQDDEMAAICKFTKSPIDFLRMVTGFRRLGQTYTNSHMGKILSGELVLSMEFEKDDVVREKVEEVDDPMDIFDADEPVNRAIKQENPVPERVEGRDDPMGIYDA